MLRSGWFRFTGTASSLLLAVVAFTAPAVAAEPSEPGQDQVSQLSSVSGTLKGGEWKKVLSGWGGYKARYAGATGAANSRYKCYTNGVKISEDRLPTTITLVVAGYGSCFFYSPVDTTYWIAPVS